MDGRQLYNEGVIYDRSGLWLGLGKWGTGLGVCAEGVTYQEVWALGLRRANSERPTVRER